jgi:hypothetical protein
VADPEVPVAHSAAEDSDPFQNDGDSDQRDGTDVEVCGNEDGLLGVNRVLGPRKIVLTYQSIIDRVAEADIVLVNKEAGMGSDAIEIVGDCNVKCE